jgi:alpha-tubulin suppressor-like RCC1 family protein
VIKFLSSFHDFNRVTLVWGCNENLSQGLHIHKNFQNFYADDEADKSSDNNDHLSGALGSQSEGAMRQLVNLSKRQRISGDDMVLFQSLLQHWQDTLLSQRTAKEEFGSVKLKGKLTYERVDKHERPTLMMSMLNSHVNEAAANGRFGLCLTPDGRVFSLGKDFRDHLANVDERQWGLPRSLSFHQPVTMMALGKDHAIFVTSSSALYSFGSNQYGQLGIDPQAEKKKKGPAQAED